VETAQLNYDWCKVKAPISGRSTRHLVDVGDLVSQNVTTLTNIVSLKPMWAYINVDQNTALRVQKLARAGEIKAPRTGEMPVAMGIGVGAEEEFPIAGTVDYISNQLDPSTGTIQVRASFPNDDESLVAGIFARIRVPLTTKHPALLVTDKAIGTNQGQKFVLVVNDKDEVEYRAVDVAQLHQGLREVLRSRSIATAGPEGNDVTKKVEVVKPDDRIIVDGLQRVRPGDKVKPILVNMQTLLVEPATDKKPAPAAEK
jgi:RND family efflux transporter MFP subunit